jgi:CDGSH-type Zn-finger protein
MARLVKRTASGPYQVQVGNETKYICGCGLSKSQPYCDGTHKTTRSEDPGKLYWYDEQGNCKEAKDSYPDIRCPS